MDQISVVELQKAQEQFVEVLTDIQKMAGSRFTGLDWEARQEAVAETTALCWKNYLHCVAQHKPVEASSLAHYAVMNVQSGRSLCGQSATDVLATRTRLLGRATIKRLDSPPTARNHDGWQDRSEALVDKRIWERPLERVRLKHDYGTFLRLPQIGQQEACVFNMLVEGYRTEEMAEKLNVSPPRICQVKNALARKLVGFMGPGIRPSRHAVRRPRKPDDNKRN